MNQLSGPCQKHDTNRRVIYDSESLIEICATEFLGSGHASHSHTHLSLSLSFLSQPQKEGRALLASDAQSPGTGPFAWAPRSHGVSGTGTQTQCPCLCFVRVTLQTPPWIARDSAGGLQSIQGAVTRGLPEVGLQLAGLSRKQAEGACGLTK